MDAIHAQLERLHVPGLKQGECYATHIGRHMDLARDHYVQCLRLIVRSFLPFMYAEIDPEHTTLADQPNGTDTTVTEQPRPNKKNQ